MPQQITVYSDSTKLLRTIRHHWQDTSFEVVQRKGRPSSADFVVTLGSIQRPVELMALQLGATAAVLPEALMYLASQAIHRGGLVLVGTDRKAARDE